MGRFQKAKERRKDEENHYVDRIGNDARIPRGMLLGI
jgi:hypothetical protein